MSNGKDLDSNNLSFINLLSTATIIAKFQPIRGDDLPLALIPSKRNARKESGQKENSRNERHLGHQGRHGHMGNQHQHGKKINGCTTETHFIWSTIPSSDPETSYAVSTGEDTSI